MALLNFIGWGAVVLFVLALLALAGLMLHSFRDRMHDPGPRHPARRGLLAEVGDDTLVMLCGGQVCESCKGWIEPGKLHVCLVVHRA